MHRQLAALLVDMVSQRPGEPRRKAPLPATLALAMVGGIHELVLQAIEQECVDKLHTLAAPASALLRAAISADF